MKVLIVGSGTLDCAAANCGIALRSLGHQVTHFDPDQHPSLLAPLRRSWRARFLMNSALTVVFGESNALFSGALRRAVSDMQPDLVLVIPINIVPPGAIEAAKKASSALVAGWFQDHMVNFGRHEFLLAPYDGLFFKDRYIVERLREWAGTDHVHYLPEACEPSRHRPVALSLEDRNCYGCDVAFYGNLYPYRARLVDPLLDDCLELRMYGSKPPRWLNHRIARRWAGREVYFEEKVKAVLSAKVVVNTSHFGEVRSVNARTFEVAGIGGFQVADAPQLAEFFEPDREVAVFRGPKSLRQVVRHFLGRPDDRREMAARAQARAHREHTYAARLGSLLRVLGMGPSAARTADGRA